MTELIKQAKDQYIQGQLSGSVKYTPQRVDVQSVTGVLDAVDILVIIRTCLGYTRKEFNVLTGFHNSNGVRITSIENRNGNFGLKPQEKIIEVWGLPKDIFALETTKQVFEQLDKWSLNEL